MARGQSFPLDNYIVDVLMRDLVGHDKQPAAFLVYLYLYTAAARLGWRPAEASLRDIAEGTGLSKSAVQTALVGSLAAGAAYGIAKFIA